MTCKPCIEKWFLRYKAHGLDDKTALKMAQKLVKRLEKRTNQKWSFFYRWVFLTNWKATFRWLRWTGKGNNPDYTRSCGECSQVGACMVGERCATPEDCGSCLIPTCPAPYPNSHLVSNTCNCITGYGACGCVSGRCTKIWGNPCVYNSGICSYNCDAGYVWNGTSCVGPKRKTMGVGR